MEYYSSLDRDHSGPGQVPPSWRSAVSIFSCLAAGCAALLFVLAPFLAGQEKAPTADLKFATIAESKAEYTRVTKPFFAKNCVTCHSPKNSEGDLDLTTLDPDMKESSSGARWAMVVEKLTSGEMPPRERPRPDAESLASVVRWAHAEAKRAGKHFARRVAHSNGNKLAHAVLFDPKNIPPFQGDPRVRRLSPEIYNGFLKDHGRVKGISQPFSPEGKNTFKDMGAPTIDEPVTAQLLQNALLIAENQTAHKIEGDKIKAIGNIPKEFLAILDPKSPPSDQQIEAAIALQFNTILKRPATDAEQKRFAGLMKKTIADAGPIHGVRYGLAAVLLLPEAVFRMEVGTGKADAKGRVRLAPREIAFALAYALTDKRPDAALLTAAATGGLDTEEGVAKEVRRMLNDPKADNPRILRFFQEYFEYPKAMEVFKEPKDFLGHDAKTLIEDTDKLVLYLFEQDKEVLRELLTTNKSFVAIKSASTFAQFRKNRVDAIAKFEAEKKKSPERYKNRTLQLPGKSIYEAYGLNDFPDVQPVELPKDQRAGILTQPSWLVAFSTSFDNHAIFRGKWVRERLLGNMVPDLPVTVDAQLPDAPEKTLRERMSVTKEEFCWKCHQFMNNTGLPFEQFDAFGRFRTTERIVDAEATAKNVDAKGKSKGQLFRDVKVDTTGSIAHVGDPALEGDVKNPIEFVKKLAGSERVEQVFVRYAFLYWMGRNENPGDAASLQAAHKTYRDSQGSMKSLISALLTSESFLYRVPVVTEKK